jgi:large subunit ribosomal protein L18
MDKKLAKKRKRRALRVKKAVKAQGVLPRVSVFKSLRAIYVQLIDDAKHETIASSSSLVVKDASGDKKSVARAVGLDLAARIKEKGVEKAVFDRGHFLYHGRIQALVEGLREGGLKI